MPVKITKIKTTGLKELEKALEKLWDPKFRRAALRRSGRAAMKPVLDDAKQNAPILQDTERNPAAEPGELRADIKMSARVNINPSVYKSSGKVRKTSKHELSVMVKTGKKSEDYALVVEYGREEFMVMRNIVFGKEVKPFWAPVAKLEPRPFMRPALDKNVTKVLDTFASVMEKEVEKQARAQLRKYNGKGK